MLVVLHGDNTVTSRAALVELLDKAREGGLVVQLHAKQLEPSELHDMLGAQDLFCQKKTIVIEQLLSQPRGKRRDALLDLVLNSEHDVVLWEGKQISAVGLKKFSRESVRSFKTSGSVFQWLDSIRPGNAKQSIRLYHEAAAKEGPELCFILFTRQIRLLLQVKEGIMPKLAPFVVSKLSSQAKQFSVNQLRQLHKTCLDLEHSMKRSRLALPISAQLDFILATI